uniref:KY-like immunoglobulin-like domain-containing protein n=1 Tax=Biomphalaria glabrata TaxID=6526 RepID=A0A2C9LHU8_BIOGL
MASSARPNLPNGFLGAQPKFSEIKLKTDSHPNAEFKVIAENNVVIKIKTGVPIKVVTKLVQCPNDKELNNYVLIQRKDKDSVRFHVAFPENGWYKFQIFALEENSATESLPNVYNYLIQVDHSFKPGQPYVKAYTKFYQDFCLLEEPLYLNASKRNLDKVQFRMIVPGAYKVAVHCGEEWFHLEKKGEFWEGKADLLKYSGKNSKVTVNGNYEKDGNSYSVLLEYTI